MCFMPKSHLVGGETLKWSKIETKYLPAVRVQETILVLVYAGIIYIL